MLCTVLTAAQQHDTSQEDNKNMKSVTVFKITFFEEICT